MCLKLVASLNAEIAINYTEILMAVVGITIFKTYDDIVSCRVINTSASGSASHSLALRNPNALYTVRE